MKVCERKRLNLDWYESRSLQNRRIKKHLIEKIVKNKSYNFTKQDLMWLNYEDLLELAIANTNRKISITLGRGKDFSDRCDAKFCVSQFRNNNVSRGIWTHSVSVSGIGFKEGPLRVCVYNKVADCFHYFFIPYKAYKGYSKLDIVFESFSNYYNSAPKCSGQPSKWLKWWQYEVGSFEEMATKE